VLHIPISYALIVYLIFCILSLGRIPELQVNSSVWHPPQPCLFSHDRQAGRHHDPGLRMRAPNLALLIVLRQAATSIGSSLSFLSETFGA